MELAQTHAVGILDDKGIHIGNVDARFDDGGADQDLNVPLRHILHHPAQLALAHFSVGDADGDIVSQELADAPGGGFDILHPVMQVVYLPAPVQLPAHGLGQNAPVMLQHIGLHRLTVPGRLLDGGHIPYARKSHIQGSGNGGGREGQGIHLGRALSELLLGCYAEALLLVDDQQPQVVEGHIFLQQLMGADEQVHLTLGGALQNFLHLLGAAETAQHLHRYGKAAETAHGGGVMLLGQHRGGHQNGRLLAV